MDTLELQGWPVDQTLTLSGSARALRLPVTLCNGSASPVAVAEASLAEVRLGAEGVSLRLDPAPVGLVVPANGTLSAHIRLRLDRATLPGRYTGQIRLADLVRPIAVEVTPDTEVAVRPDPVVVDAALGPAQRLAVGFENLGNTVLTLDLTGRYPLGEELPLGGRLAPEAEGLGKLGPVLEQVLGLAPRPAMVEAGAVELSMPGGPVQLPPGGAVTLDIDVVLPGALSPTARHHVFAPVYAADLHIVVVTAAKPGPPAKAGRRTKRTEG
jgi:hypothetical protein